MLLKQFAFATYKQPMIRGGLFIDPFLLIRKHLESLTLENGHGQWAGTPSVLSCHDQTPGNLRDASWYALLAGFIRHHNRNPNDNDNGNIRSSVLPLLCWVLESNAGNPPKSRMQQSYQLSFRNSCCGSTSASNPFAVPGHARQIAHHRRRSPSMDLALCPPMKY